MQIHQIQTGYNEVQDRILLRLSTADNCEFLFWLTRRFTKRFWPLLLKMLEHDDAVRQQTGTEARRAVLGMRHEALVQQSDFSSPFEQRQYQRPLGSEPLLVARADCTPRADGLVVLALRPVEGQGVELALDARMLHSICKLLADALGKADWSVDVTTPQAAASAAEPAAPGPPRTLN